MRGVVLFFAFAIAVPAFAADAPPHPIRSVEHHRQWLCGSHESRVGKMIELEGVIMGVVDRGRQIYARSIGRSSLPMEVDPVEKLMAAVLPHHGVNFSSVEAVTQRWPLLQDLVGAMDKWLEYAAKMEEAVHNQISALRQVRGLSAIPADMEQWVSSAKGAIQRAVWREPELDRPTKDVAVQTISQMRLLSSKWISSVQDPVERFMLAQRYFEACGPQLMSFEVAANLVEFKALKTVTRVSPPILEFCPGARLRFQDAPDVNSAVTYLVGHEAAHHFSQHVSRSFSSLRSTIYANFDACAKNRTDGLTDIRNLLKKHDKAWSLSGWLAWKSSPVSIGEASEFRHTLKWADEALEREATIYDTHAQEVQADLWGFRALAETLDGDRHHALAEAKAALGYLCDGIEDGVHPSTGYRVRMMLSMPEIAAKVGTAPATSCGLEGPIPPTPRGPTAPVSPAIADRAQ